ncbi:hypothetical protein [Streptomyces sp. NPDC002067]
MRANIGGEPDICIAMTCGDVCPVLPNKRYLDWQLELPSCRGVEAVCRAPITTAASWSAARHA